MICFFLSVDTIASLWQQQQINSPREKISKNQLQSQDETLIKTQDEVMQKTIRDVPGPFAFPYFGSSRPKLKAIQTVDYCRGMSRNSRLSYARKIFIW